MAKKQNQQKPNAQASGTNVEKVKQQNQAAEQGQYGAEFASETDAQEVQRRNQQSQQKKNQQNK
ncbi:gamma-type small acid-soluble spore protein [Piscibacillus salipiscarius]|uniref:Small, acid-soluble spore protein gamma-type n=1 Tax=Piscibacillus salipiscarius TaxID=299480 RepID=A0ABW5QBD9_9BACI|nr:gamma-type small acid-soluble spore protein [Piscibacillus salipiscarius]